MKISNNYAHIFENYVEYSPMMFKYWSSSSLIRAVSTDPHKTFLFYFLIIVFNFPYPKTFHTDFYIFLLSLRDYIYICTSYIQTVYIYIQVIYRQYISIFIGMRLLEECFLQDNNNIYVRVYFIIFFYLFRTQRVA